MSRTAENDRFLRDLETAFKAGDAVRVVQMIIVKSARSVQEDLGRIKAMEVAVIGGKAVEMLDQPTRSLPTASMN